MSRPNVSNQKRQQIIDAFGLCFLEKPYEMITLKEIAQKADIPSGSVYFYFPTKEEILVAHAHSFWQSFEDDFTKICNHLKEEKRTLSEFSKLFFFSQRNYLADHSSDLSIRYLGLIHHPQILSRIRKTQEFIFAQIVDAITICQVRCTNPYSLAKVLYSIVDGISLGELIWGTDDSNACYDELIHLFE